jgi:hypothetical protein
MHGSPQPQMPAQANGGSCLRESPPRARANRLGKSCSRLTDRRSCPTNTVEYPWNQFCRQPARALTLPAPGASTISSIFSARPPTAEGITVRSPSPAAASRKKAESTAISILALVTSDIEVCGPAGRRPATHVHVQRQSASDKTSEQLSAAFRSRSAERQLVRTLTGDAARKCAANSARRAAARHLFNFLNS